MIKISVPARRHESLVMADIDGKPVQVGHVRRPMANYYKAILWERAGQRQDNAERERVIIRPSLRDVRQALRDRVRLGKWWT